MLWPASVLSITIALNVATAQTFALLLRPRWRPEPERRARSSRSAGEPRHRLLDDRQIDDGREQAEHHTEPPHDVVGAGTLVDKAAEIDAQEAADLMAEERDPEQ